MSEASRRSARTPTSRVGSDPPEEPLHRAAYDVLGFSADGAAADLFLWRRAVRLERTALCITGLPDFRSWRCDRQALSAAALFSGSGWAEEVRAGRLSREQAGVAAMTTELRERCVDLLMRHTEGILSPTSQATAARALREAAVRSTETPEAIALSEALELDAIGPMWLLAEVRRSWLEGRDVASLIEAWQGQERYGYWEARIRERLRFEPCRRVARHRLPGLAAFVDTLRAQLEAEDLGPLTRE